MDDEYGYDDDDDDDDEREDAEAAHYEQLQAQWEAEHPSVQERLYRVWQKLRWWHEKNFTRCQVCKKLIRHCECIPF